MAHFAKLNDSNVVTEVIVVHNNELLVNGVESEVKGIEFCQSLFGGQWVQTSYNANFRKNYAGIGDIYDPIRDAFIKQKPYESWVLNEETCKYNAPVDYPTDKKNYYWNEETISWVEFIIEA
jgi:hypothetical protein